MAEHSRREVTITNIQYVLPNPTNAAEYAKACNAAVKELESMGREVYDDSITVAGSDEEIILSFRVYK